MLFIFNGIVVLFNVNMAIYSSIDLVNRKYIVTQNNNISFEDIKKNIVVLLSKKQYNLVEHSIERNQDRITNSEDIAWVITMLLYIGRDDTLAKQLIERNQDRITNSEDIAWIVDALLCRKQYVLAKQLIERNQDKITNSEDIAWIVDALLCEGQYDFAKQLIIQKQNDIVSSKKDMERIVIALLYEKQYNFVQQLKQNHVIKNMILLDK